MVMKTTALLALLSISMISQADTGPNKAAAESWLTDFREARDKTSDSGFIADETARRNHVRVLMGLHERAEKLFGAMDDCTLAANLVNSYWSYVHDLMRHPTADPIQLSAIVTMSWEGGQRYAICRDSIDGLK
jgi:hypothetical protein